MCNGIILYIFIFTDIYMHEARLQGLSSYPSLWIILRLPISNLESLHQGVLGNKVYGHGQGLLPSLTSGAENVSTVFSVFYFVASPFPDNMDQEDTDDAQDVVLPSPSTSQQLIS